MVIGNRKLWSCGRKGRRERGRFWGVGGGKEGFSLHATHLSRDCNQWRFIPINAANCSSFYSSFSLDFHPLLYSASVCLTRSCIRLHNEKSSFHPSEIFSLHMPFTRFLSPFSFSLPSFSPLLPFCVLAFNSLAFLL